MFSSSRFYTSLSNPINEMKKTQYKVVSKMKMRARIIQGKSHPLSHPGTAAAALHGPGHQGRTVVPNKHLLQHLLHTGVAGAVGVQGQRSAWRPCGLGAVPGWRASSPCGACGGSGQALHHGPLIVSSCQTA